MIVRVHRDIAVAACLLWAALHYTGATHFRGALITWKPVNATDPSSRKVSISTRIAWRRSYGSSTSCDQNTISSGNLIGPSGFLTCRVGCSGNIESMFYKCTDFSIQEDWSAGERTYEYEFPSGVNPPLFQASFTGGDWIALVQGGGSWEVRVYFNLTQRNDTGKVNTSPKTAMSPIVKLQHGCNHTIVIPVSDADKDEVRCRWAESSRGECAGVCQTFRGAILKERACVIEYRAVHSIGWYGVALMIEDFSDPLSAPLSSVPLQFLVHVFQSSELCQSKPQFVGTTRVGGSCIGVPFGTQYFEPVIARSGGKTSRINEITTISPPGLTKSTLGQHSSREWYVNITWTPSQSQLGPNIFCFTALDSTGLTSTQRCVTLLGGVAPPKTVNGSQSPIGLIYANHNAWLLKFDQQFVRPARSTYIRVRSSDGSVVYSIDVAITNTVLYPAGSVGRTLQFTLGYSFKEKQTYYITMDPGDADLADTFIEIDAEALNHPVNVFSLGIAKGIRYCGAESPAIRDPYFWRVKIRDVTPPKVTFLSSPTLTNDNITFTWRTDEESTIVCTIVAPDRAFRAACNDSWTGVGLAEGNYRISVMATDSAGNTALPVSRSWTVDKTPPKSSITAKPNNVTKSSSASFAFTCTDKDWYWPRCSFDCDVKPQGTQPSGYSSCSGRYSVSNLADGRVYVFWLRTRDQAGNVAPVMTYQWRIDQTPPTISGLNTLTVPCTSDLNPVNIGKPTASDNEDPAPSLVHTDAALTSGCGVSRTWTAKDRAGNIASGVQIIRISNPTAPVVKYNRSIIVACETVVGIAEGLQKEIHVSHPCGMPVNITHADSVQSMKCDATFIRYWTIRDACGYNVTLPQSIQVLGLQPPDYPTNGQVNVGLNQQLSWPQYPGAVRYKIYIWKHGTSQPAAPTAETSQRSYDPANQQFPHGSKMLWKVEYVLGSGDVIPSPIWGFVTRPYMDFKVEAVTLPQGAFSGQSMTISWTVRNIGGIGNARFDWQDFVYIGKTTTLSDARLFARKSQRRILDKNDGYTDSVAGMLKNDEIGVFYAFVKTYNWGDDIDRSNNWRMSSGSVKVSLTPPPNLKVDSIAIPSSSFSGRSISVTWVVTNHGLGTTKAPRWYDRVLFSSDDTLDNKDIRLGDFEIALNRPLFSGLSYKRTKSVQIPNAVYGNFSILVATDVRNDVFEYTAEGDNLLAKPMKIVLTPPPDLIVSDISTASPSFKTGDSVTIVYRVTNDGFGSPFENFWADKMFLTHLLTGSRLTLATRYFSGVLPPRSSYSRDVTFVVPPSLKPGQYNISVRTDYANQVFEFRSDNNNVAQLGVTIVEAFPDLVVPEVSARLGHDSFSAYVRVNFTVTNRGVGTTYGAPWSDSVYISTSTTLSLQNSKFLGTLSRTSSLAPSKSYVTKDVIFRIPRNEYGRRYIVVYVDAFLSVAEQARSNNFGNAGPFQVSRVVPDLVVQDITVKSSTDVIYADSAVTVNWEVRNSGNGRTLGETWKDVILLSWSSTPRDSDLKLFEVTVSTDIKIGSSYKKSYSVMLPDDISGEWYLVLHANSDKRLAETSYDNNRVTVPIAIRVPWRPDFVVLGVSYYYSEPIRLLTVNWLASNDAFSMETSLIWSDEVVLSPSLDRSTGDDVFSLGSTSTQARLYSQQHYGGSLSYTIPKSLTGNYYVHVIVNAGGKVKEKLRGRPNDGFSTVILALSRAPSPKLETKIITSMNFTNITMGKGFQIEFEVHNAGSVDATQDSWTDAVYVHSTPAAKYSEVQTSGVRLATNTHTGGLKADTRYTVAKDIIIPHNAPTPIHIYVFSDINNRTGSSSIAESFSRPVVVTQGKLPDLRGAFKQNSLRTRGGQPLNINVTLQNKGPGAATGTWYNAFYLSEDVLIDPFDVKLASLAISKSIESNSTLDVEHKVFIPFDTLSGQYYLLVAVDSDNREYETDENNNIAHVLVELTSAPLTDLLVSSVSTQPQTLGLGSSLTVGWQLRNNGTRQAQGYKCDTVYLSQDETWQIEDTALGRPKCSWVTMKPHNNGANPDLSSSLTSSLAILPPGEYQGLVKSRSNIRDIYPDNNIKAGPKNLNVSYPKLELGSCNEVSSAEEVFVIPGVPVDETLTVTASANDSFTSQFLYVRHGKPATSNVYDSGSKFAVTANQEAIVESTRSGAYFVLLKKTDKTPQHPVKSTVCAKLAKFEIKTVSPKKVTPLGNVTLKIQGSLFGWKMKAYLANEQGNNTLQALNIYRLSSNLLYSTFDFKQVAVGTLFSLRLLNEDTLEEAFLNKSVEVKDGIPGKLSMVLNSPRAFRAEEVGLVTISYQNVGGTDLMSPVSLFTTSGVTLARLLQDGKTPGAYSQTILFIAQPLEGPGGILPPQSYGQISLQVKQGEGNILGRSRLGVDVIVNSDVPHMFMNNSDDLKPAFLSQELWKPVWENFLSSVGSTQESLNRRLCSLATQLSLNGRRVYSVDELITFQISFANGLQYGSPLLDFIDAADTGTGGSLILQLERIYNPLLTKRRDKGVFGVGWISPLWEIKVSNTSESSVKILRSRDELVFIQQEDTGLYLSKDKQRVSINNTDIVYDDGTGSYIFRATDKRLKQIRSSTNTEAPYISVESYTSEGRPRMLSYSTGGSLTVTFNGRGLIREVVLAKESGTKETSLYEYDEDTGYLTAVTVNEKTTRYKYNSDGDIESVTYPRGSSLQYTYNKKGFIDSMTAFSEDGTKFKEVIFKSDWNGVVTITNKAENSYSTVAFDENMKPYAVAGLDGIPARTQSYVTEHQISRTTLNGDQVLQKQTFSIPKQTMTTEDANGATMRYISNKEGFPLNITDPIGSKYTYKYDRNNKLVESSLPDGTKESSKYDEAGRLVTRTVRNGGKIQFEYGDDGNVAKKTVPDVGSTYYLHDARGNLIMATNKIGSVSIQYDNENRPISVTYPDGRRLRYRYNSSGRRIALTEDSTGYNVTYHYDKFNRLSEVHSGGTLLMRVTQNTTENTERRAFGNGAVTLEKFLPGTRTLKELHNKGPNGRECSNFVYEYDRKGRPVKITSLRGTRKMKYDAMSQLVEWSDLHGDTVANGTKYGYDTRKNRAFDSNQITDERMNYVSNSVNQYTSAGKFDFLYDKNGNMISKKNREARAQDVTFVFSDDNVLLKTETANERCNYIYDGLGLLYKKKCASGDTRYIMDPFAVFGENVIGKIAHGNVTQFVHAEEKGLISMIENGQVYYYQFNGEGSVINLYKYDCESPMNSYEYDPFGRLLAAQESVRNDFLFIGQWGVLRSSDVPGLYRMRFRSYDSQLGRFISYDPLADASLEPNFYLYANNNPLMLQDPNGRFALLVVAGGALIGGAANAVAYTLGSLATGEKWTLGGAAGSALSGAITGAATTAAASLGPVAAAYIGSRTAALANGLGYALQTKIDGTKFDGKELLSSMANGLIFGGLPIKTPGLSKTGLPEAVKKFADGVTGGLVSGLAPKLDKVGERLAELADKIRKALNDASDAAKELGKKIKKAIDDFIDWIRSRDPNDMIGPAGIGDAHFITSDRLLDYKIRYENHPNASAPAQRVFIRHKLDPDIDPRTFTVGSFGFGDFTKNVESKSSVFQETLDYQSKDGLLVRIVAGIDVVSNQVTWDLQTIDPNTGEPPDDPRKGFLPPNNGTTGQGYVTFSVRIVPDVRSMARIDAQASIIFDSNEPIDTPPIFNTIDNTSPTTNLTVVKDALETGSLVVMVTKNDVGAGVKSVDVYYKEVIESVSRSVVARPTEYKPLLRDVVEDTAVLPLAQGKSYRLVTAAVDHVGNQEEPRFDESTLVNFPNVTEKQPLETLQVDVSSNVTQEDAPIPVRLSARFVGLNSTVNTSLVMTIFGLPESFELSRGVRDGNVTTLKESDFGNLQLLAPKDFSGIKSFRVTTTAVAGVNRLTYNRFLNINVRAIADKPRLYVSDACFNGSTKIPLSIMSDVADKDGSENLTVTVSGLPEDNSLSVYEGIEDMTYYLNRNMLDDLALVVSQDFAPFVLRITATATEISNGNTASKEANISITVCQFSCASNCSGHGKCVGHETCICEDGFTGHDCSAVIETAPPGKGDANIAAIAGGAVGGLVLLIILIAVLVCCLRRRKKPKADTRVRSWYTNPSYAGSRDMY